MVVDTSAVIAILAGEPEGAACGRAIADAAAVVMSTANYLELVMVALSRDLAGRAEVEGLILDARITLIAVSIEHAGMAITAFQRFGNGRHPAKLNYGDCFAYALAKQRREPLLYKGNDFSQTDVLNAL
jgi:ribonuclease VapC